MQLTQRLSQINTYLCFKSNLLQERKGTSLTYFKVFFNCIKQFSRCISVYLVLFWFISVYFGLSWSISAHLGLSRSILVYLAQSISDFLRLSQIISDYLEISGTIWAYLGLSGTTSDYLRLWCKQRQERASLSLFETFSFFSYSQERFLEELALLKTLIYKQL